MTFCFTSCKTRTIHNYRENVLAVGMMRQANFPDQKALTARDETNSKPSQQSWTGSLTTVVTYCSARVVQGQRKHWAENNPFPLPTTHSAWISHPHHCFGQACGRQFSSSSELLPPYAKLPHGWATRYFSWEPPATRFLEAAMSVHL
jgi:hypothetical protein